MRLDSSTDFMIAARKHILHSFPCELNAILSIHQSHPVPAPRLLSLQYPPVPFSFCSSYRKYVPRFIRYWRPYTYPRPSGPLSITENPTRAAAELLISYPLITSYLYRSFRSHGHKRGLHSPAARLHLTSRQGQPGLAQSSTLDHIRRHTVHRIQVFEPRVAKQRKTYGGACERRE